MITEPKIKIKKGLVAKIVEANFMISIIVLIKTEVLSVTPAILSDILAEIVQRERT